MVETPEHYKPNGVISEEPIEVMYRSMSREAFEGACIFNVFKYVSRFREKGGDKDLDKAIDYIEFLRCSYHGVSPTAPKSKLKKEAE